MSEIGKGYHFFAMMDRMRLIKRWSLMRNHSSENLAEHSLMVALVAHAMAILRNANVVGEPEAPKVDAERVAVMGLYHDAPEIITGDLPTPVKYYDDSIREAYRRVEESALERLLSFLPDFMIPEYRGLMCESDCDEKALEERQFVRAADRICAYLKCAQEVQSGNGEFALALRQSEQRVRRMGLPEADYFMKHFADSFSLTLDELNPT